MKDFIIDKFNQYGLNEKAKVSTCPKCSHTRKKKTDKCLMLDWDRGLGTCQHCGEVIQLHTYEKRHTEKAYIKPEWKNKTELSDKLVNWFLERGISQDVLNSMKISEDVEYMPQVNKEINTIQFNYFINDELINIKYRDGAKNFKLNKGSEKIFYNLNGLIGRNDAVIVEGEMDVLSFIQDGVHNVVSVPNGATKGNNNLDYLDNCYEYFEDKESIYIATDNDEAGISLRTELIRRLGAERCYLVDFKDCKDANEYLLKYNHLKDVIENAEPVPIENIITLEDEKEQLRDFYINGAKKGFCTGLESFDKIFSTYTSQYVVVTGIPSSGKSDFVDMMTTSYNMSYGWKTAYCSPENKPNYLHLDKICRKFYGKYPKGEDLNTEDWQQVEDHVNDNFYFIDYDGAYELKSILSKGAELVKRKGIKCLVIDPYNKVRLKESKGKSITDYTEDYLNEIDNFCRKYDVLVVLVAHPKKMHKEAGKNNLPEPTFYDVKGGGEFYDMSYHGLLVHRDYETETVKVKVLKVKFHHLGENQAETNLVWSKSSGRYCEIAGDVGEHETLWDNKNWLNDKQHEPEETFSIHTGYEGLPENTEIPF